MSKISVPKFFELSKALSTSAGQELSDVLNYISVAFLQLINAVNNGLTFKDNFACQIQAVSLTHNTEQKISFTGTSVSEVFAMRTLSQTTCVTGLIWYFSNQNELVINAQFLGSPTTPQTVVLRINY